MAVLEALAGSHEGISASTMARTLGLSTSTLSLILSTLRELNYVERMPDRTFRLGFGVMRLVNGLQVRFPMLGVAHEELGRLSDMFGCGCSLTRLGAGRQQVILTSGSTDELGIRPGVQLTMDPPHGTLAMAWRSPREIDRWLANAPRAGSRDLRVALSTVRQLGYAVYGIRSSAGSMIGQLRDLLRAVQKGDSAESLRSELDRLALIVGSRIYSVEQLASSKHRPVSHIIAPVFGRDGQPGYLVALHVMRDSVSSEELGLYVEALLRAAKLLTEQLGGKPSGAFLLD